MRTNDLVVQSILTRMKEMEISGKPFYWVRPWTGGAKFPVSYRTKKPYRGVNIILLDSGEYVTKKFLLQHGGSLKEGALPRFIVFFNVLKCKKLKPDDREKYIPFLRKYEVFDLEDTEGLESHYPATTIEHDATQSEVLAWDLINRWIKEKQIRLEFIQNGGHCFWDHRRNLLRTPEREEFNSLYSFYSALFHEIVHSTADDLGRKPSIEKYSEEELIAQIGSQMLLNHFGFIPKDDDFDNDVNYLRGWSSALQGNVSIISAGNKAQKAFDYLIEGVCL